MTLSINASLPTTISFREIDPPEEACPICLETTLPETDDTWIAHDVPNIDTKVQHCFHRSCLKKTLIGEMNLQKCPLCFNVVDLTNFPDVLNERAKLIENIRNEIKKHVDDLNRLQFSFSFIGLIASAVACSIIQDSPSPWSLLGTMTASSTLSIVIGCMGLNTWQASRGYLNIERAQSQINMLFNALFFGGALGLLSHTDPLFIGSFGYAPFLIGLSYFYLPSKFRLDFENFPKKAYIIASSDFMPHLIGIISTLAWTSFRG